MFVLLQWWVRRDRAAIGKGEMEVSMLKHFYWVCLALMAALAGVGLFNLI